MSQAVYRPLQPSVTTGSSLYYEELLPKSSIQKYIYCYWQLKTLRPLSKEFNYRVIADGCIDIFFNTRNPEESFVMGFSQQFVEFPIGHTFSYSGIRFQPSYFSQIFGVDAKSLADDTKQLAQVVPQVAQFIAQLDKELTLGEIADRFDHFLEYCCRETTFIQDERFYEALQLIFQNNGHLGTESDLNTGLSPRQLRRVFNRYIGTTPKSFCKVVRFQSVIRKLHENKSLPNPAIYLDAGFFDQAHFIKDFKQFYGVTPKQVYF